MRSRYLVVFITASLALLTSVGPGDAATTAGSKCTKIGAKSTSSGKKFTCVKVGKKLIWSKVATEKTSKTSIQETDQIGTTTPTPTEVPMTICGLDKETPSNWLSVQQATIAVGRCLPPFRYIPGKVVDYTPSNQVSDAKDLLPISECKVRDVSGFSTRFGRANFGQSARQNWIFTPSRNANILVVGIQFTDVQSSGNPEKDFKKYTDFYKEFLETSADIPLNVNYKFTNNYIQMGKSLSSYNLADEHADTAPFMRDFLAITDPLIDFSNLGQVLIVAPAETHPSLLSAHMNWYSNWQTNEGLIPSVYLHGPILPTNPQIDRIWSVSPWITIHEAFGHQLGLDDHLGDEQVFSHAKSSSDFRDYGAPMNNMSGANGDFLAWDKWLSGLISDDQVRCASKDKSTVHFIRPNSTHGQLVKAVVVPISDGKALEIESFRSTGWNWKFDSVYSGVRVHLVDRTDPRINNFGLYLLRSEDKPGSRDGKWPLNNLFDATLKLNESLTAFGVKISVLEAGDFGDVVKVEKVNQ